MAALVGMASTAKLDRQTLDELANGPAGSLPYLRQKELAIRRSRNHVTQVEMLNFDEVLKNDEALENRLKILKLSSNPYSILLIFLLS